MNTSIETSAYAHPSRQLDLHGKLSRALLDALATAYSVANTLISDGYRPYRITIQGAIPTVWIHPTTRCRHLRGVTKTISNLPGQGRTVTMASRLGGAQIQWTINRGE